VRRNLTILAGWFGDYDTARSLLAESLSASDRLDDRLGRAYALRELGKVEMAQGDAEGAVATLRQSIAITDDLDNRWESAMTENDLGNALAALGDLDAARTSLRRCLEEATDADNRYYVARCTGDLGALAAVSGNRPEAHELLNRAKVAWEQFGHEPYLAWTIVQLAHLARTDDGGTAGAATLYREALELAVRHELAPFVAEIAVGAVRIGRPDDPDARSALLRGVARLDAAAAAVRDEAATQLADDTVLDASDADRADWRSIATFVADALTDEA
jgi:tetratricopeptide (TPR) repeat protein